MDTKVSFPYGFQDHAKGFLDNPVVNGGDTERSLFSIGFGDIRPSDRHGFKGFGSEGFTEALQIAIHVPIEVAHGFAVYPRRVSSRVGIDRMMSDSEPHDITEQAIDVHSPFVGILCRPLTQFPLQFAHIHRASPVAELPLHKKFPKAKGLCHWGILLLLFPSMWTALPSADYYTLSATSWGIGVSLGSPLPTVHSPWHPSGSFPCSVCRTQTERCRWRVADCPFRSLRLPSRTQGRSG